MVRVYLDAKIDSPTIDTKIEDIISIKIKKELENFSNQLADEIAELIKKHKEIKIFNESA